MYIVLCFIVWLINFLSLSPSVRPSVCKLCANRYFYHKHDSIATKFAHDGPHMDLHPGCAQGQGQDQRSRDTDTFLPTRKSLLLPPTWLDRDQTCTRRSPHGPASRVCSRSRSRSKVSDTGTSVMSRNVCYTVRSHGLFLHALTLWNTIILSFQYNYQAARCLIIGMSYSVIDGLVLWNRGFGCGWPQSSISVVR